MSPALYLADTSALMRFYRGQCHPYWEAIFETGRVGLCEPVRQEYLRGVGPKASYYEAETTLGETLPHYEVPEWAFQRTSALQMRLAEASRHQGASVIDMLVAVTADHHHLVVLHADRDFDTVASLIGSPVQRADQPPLDD